MFDADAYFKIAAANYRQAEEHLKETEIHLRKLLARLDRAAAGVPAVPREGMALWGRVDDIISGQPAAGIEEPVSAVS